MISTQIPMRAAQGQTSGGHCLLLGGLPAASGLVGMVGGTLLDFPGSGVLGLLAFGTLGLIVAALVIVAKGKQNPQQIITTLESDGKTIWGYNERRPDVERKGRIELFSLPLDAVGGCESGKADDVFSVNSERWLGQNLTIGAQTVLQSLPVGNSGTREYYKSALKRTAAIYLRTSSNLIPIYADILSAAEVFAFVAKVNNFLDESRALRAGSASAGAPAGFDL